MKTYQELVAELNGRKIDFDGNSGAQCVDLAKKYQADCVGGTVVRGNAKEWWDEYDRNKFDRIPNTLTFVPRKGDIMVWKGSVNPVWSATLKRYVDGPGHIGIVDSANLLNFTSFDQNWPLNTGCHFQKHSYSHVFGVLRPKVANTTFVVETTAILNVRRDSNTSQAPVRTLPKGARVTVIGSKNGASVNGNSIWYQIGANEYISAYWTKKV